MHDFHKNTAEALPELLHQLKGSGYKVVHMVPRQSLTTLPKYDEMVTQQGKLSSNNTRPETNVVRAIGAHVLEPWSFEPPSSAGTSKSSSPGSGGAGGRGPAGALVRRTCTCRWLARRPCRSQRSPLRSGPSGPSRQHPRNRAKRSPADRPRADQSSTVVAAAPGAMHAHPLRTTTAANMVRDSPPATPRCRRPRRDLTVACARRPPSPAPSALQSLA